jgi:hypothetical protein
MATDNELNIELRSEVALGTYSNLAIITHSSSEFILDFISMLPGIPKPQVNSRIIMTAEHAKKLMLAIQDNIAKYEQQYGEIILQNEQKKVFPMGFGGNSFEA